MQLREQWLSKIAEVSRVAANAAIFNQHIGPRALRSQTGPWKIITPVTTNAHGVDGFSITSVKDVALLRDLPLHSLVLRNSGGDECGLALAKLISTLPLDPSRLQINFGLHDIKSAKVIHDQGFTGQFFNVAEDDLGTNLAVAVGLMRRIDFLSDQQVSTTISVTLRANQNIFATMAKFRAMRILWSRVLRESKLPDTPLALHGEMDAALYVNTDPSHFMMRAVASVMGAGLGGANSILVQPFSPQELDVRMARNVQIIMQQESHMWRVNDPAAGAGYVEHLTEKLCEQAWDGFVKSERNK